MWKFDFWSLVFYTLTFFLFVYPVALWARWFTRKWNRK